MASAEMKPEDIDAFYDRIAPSIANAADREAFRTICARARAWTRMRSPTHADPVARPVETPCADAPVVDAAAKSLVKKRRAAIAKGEPINCTTCDHFDSATLTMRCRVDGVRMAGSGLGAPSFSYGKSGAMDFCPAWNEENPVWSPD